MRTLARDDDEQDAIVRLDALEGDQPQLKSLSDINHKLNALNVFLHNRLVKLGPDSARTNDLQLTGRRAAHTGDAEGVNYGEPEEERGPPPPSGYQNTALLQEDIIK